MQSHEQFIRTLNDEFKAVFGDTENFKEWLFLFGIEPTESDEESEDLCIGMDDHKLLLSIDNVRDGYGVWTDGNHTKSWVNKNADWVHSFVCDLLDNHQLSWYDVFVRSNCDNEFSWLMEDVLAGKPSSNYNLDKFLGFFVGNELLRLYQSTMADFC